MTIQELIEELTELRDKAELRSRELVRDGKEVSDVNRARSEGYASAYSFCIMRLREIRRLGDDH